MKRLLLMRHAKSSWKVSCGDRDRPLSPRGMKSAVAVAKELKRLGCLPCLVLSSDARRTRETYARMTSMWADEDLPVRVEYLAEFYAGVFDRPATEVIMDAVYTNARSEDTVMVLGHNMGWELALNELVGPRGRAGAPVLEMKTADCFVLERDMEEWEDIFTSYGKWAIRHQIRSRNLLTTKEG
mmetsp:Transcript_5809/g.17545  ORF Transcript_5809/g.17545 Transcript_5809/m.17545 type:complete len:184 (-) Transcript_5809:1446-1997(-)